MGGALSCQHLCSRPTSPRGALKSPLGLGRCKPACEARRRAGESSGECLPAPSPPTALHLSPEPPSTCCRSAWGPLGSRGWRPGVGAQTCYGPGPCTRLCLRRFPLVPIPGPFWRLPCVRRFPSLSVPLCWEGPSLLTHFPYYSLICFPSPKCCHLCGRASCPTSSLSCVFILFFVLFFSLQHSFFFLKLI